MRRPRDIRFYHLLPRLLNIKDEASLFSHQLTQLPSTNEQVGCLQVWLGGDSNRTERYQKRSSARNDIQSAF